MNFLCQTDVDRQPACLAEASAALFLVAVDHCHPAGGLTVYDLLPLLAALILLTTHETLIRRGSLQQSTTGDHS